MGADRQRHRGRRGGDGLEEVAEFAELLALSLRSGLPPGEAIEIAQRDASNGHSRVTEVADQLAGLDADGPAAAAAPTLTTAGADSSSLLTAAWALGLDCGAPLTEAVEASAGALRAASAARRRAAAARAGPKASMWLLTVLPVAGPGAALAIGADPMATFGQPVALGSVAAGLALTGLGWWWSRRLLARAEASAVFT